MHNIQFLGVLRNAEKARENGNFSLAISLYRHAIIIYPEISWMYRQNLDRINSSVEISPIKVVVNICSIPERVFSLEKTIKSLVHQVDKINIYLDGYVDAPQFLSSISKFCNITFSGKDSSLRDNGKFMNLEEDNNCYYFSVDDDIVYPPDYVAFMISKIEQYDRKAVIGVHGIILPEEPDRYFSRQRKVLHFESAVDRDILVNVLGTGTVAFHSRLLQGMKLGFFEKTGMADVFISIFCKKNMIPMIAVSRPSHWLVEIENCGSTLYEEFLHSDVEQTTLIRKNSPWGKQGILALAGEFYNNSSYSNLFLEMNHLSFE